MPPPTARQKAGETDIFKLDSTDICTLGLQYHVHIVSTCCAKSLKTVNVRTGDEVIFSGEAAFPNIIKIDVEGHELEVVRGAVRCAVSHKRAWTSLCPKGAPLIQQHCKNCPLEADRK
jgi:FkbM family methyltransferase